LRDTLANDPGVAFAAVLHALCLGAFYRRSSDTCLEISAKSASFNSQAPGLADSASAKAIEAHHQHWAKQLPKHEEDLSPTVDNYLGRTKPYGRRRAKPRRSSSTI
jgi:ParB family chromosome partitioning protein